MEVEKVVMLRYVKAGSTVFPKGKEFTAPDIPSAVMDEVNAGADTVRVLTTTTSYEPKAADSSPAPAPPQIPETEQSEQDVSGETETEKEPQVFCEACGAGPYRDGRGLSLHYHRSAECKPKEE